VNYLSDTSFIYFVDRVKDRLQELWIDGETFTDAAFSKLGEIKKLRVLSISFADSMQSAKGGERKTPVFRFRSDVFRHETPEAETS